MDLCGRPANQTNSIRSCLVVFLAIAILLSSGCTKGKATPKPPEGTFPVDPLFRDFYEQHGGRNTLGPAISPVINNDNKIYQYTVAGLLVYDRDALEGERVDLFPVGRDMGVIELPSGKAPEPGERYQSGYKIFDKFVPLYDQLGGEAFTGKPLSEAHLNTLKSRYEQYFENLGFYWLEGDRDNAVHLLEYGAWECDRYCPSPTGVSLPKRPPHSYVLSFVTKAAELGLDFTGFAISEPYYQAGQIRQIYENIVFTADQQDQSDVGLVALPNKIIESAGMHPEAPRPPSPAPDMEFYDVGENLGYNIPKAFAEYIQAHGGFELVGEPVNHVSRPDDQTLRQCFVSICLQGQVNEAGQVAVSVMPLGVRKSTSSRANFPYHPTW